VDFSIQSNRVFSFSYASYCFEQINKSINQSINAVIRDVLSMPQDLSCSPCLALFVCRVLSCQYAMNLSADFCVPMWPLTSVEGPLYGAAVSNQSINQSRNFYGGLTNKLLPQGPQRETVMYKTRPGYESQNRCSCSRFLKVSRDGAEVTSTGRSFHVRTPAVANISSV